MTKKDLIELLEEFPLDQEIVFDITKGPKKVREFVSIDGLYEVKHPEGDEMVALFSDILAEDDNIYLNMN